jgi:hypothetical protein
MIDKNILLVNMQMDCNFANTVMAKVQNIIGVKLSDDELDEWLIDGACTWIRMAHRIATGVDVNGDIVLEMHHLDYIEDIEVMSKQVFYDIYNDLEKLSKIDYFDMIAHNGSFIIHPNEFNGKGCTKMVLLQFGDN